MSWWKKRENNYGERCNSIPGQEQDNTRRIHFTEVVRLTDSLLCGVTDTVERVALYDFVIWALGCQIAADSRGLFVHGEETPENRSYDVRSLFPPVVSNAPEVLEVDLAKVPTCTGPWNRNRFSNGILSVFNQGFQKELARNEGLFFRELNFAVMLSGRHHTSWGIFTGACVQPLQVVALEPYFSSVKTDGAYFTYLDADGNPVKRKAIDYRFAAMYHLAQRKWEVGYPADLSLRVIENRKQLQEEARQKQDSLSCDETTLLQLLSEQTKLRSTLYAQKEEIQYLQQRCKELEQALSSTSSQNNS